MGGIFSKRKRKLKKPTKNIKAISDMTRSISDDDVDDNGNSKNELQTEKQLPPLNQIEEEIIPITQPKFERSYSIMAKPNQNYRIHPLEQHGTKMSNTHYFCFEEPPRYRRVHSTKERGNPIEMYENSSRLFNERSEEPLLPFDLGRHFDNNKNNPGPSCNCGNVRNDCDSPKCKIPYSPIRSHHHHYQYKHNTLPVRRGRSDMNDYLYNQNRAMIAKMLMSIPQATDAESHGVLMGTNWNFEEAERRLKKELVFRVCRASYRQCESILQQHNWDLNSALASIENQ